MVDILRVFIDDAEIRLSASSMSITLPVELSYWAPSFPPALWDPWRPGCGWWRSTPSSPWADRAWMMCACASACPCRGCIGSTGRRQRRRHPQLLQRAVQDLQEDRQREGRECEKIVTQSWGDRGIIVRITWWNCGIFWGKREASLNQQWRDRAAKNKEKNRSIWFGCTQFWMNVR